ncbi:MAG: glycosyltransferase [Desulfobulbaceae bacterium]|jgi:glycosyltransferase involved in cell wall biosynthesis
MNRSDLIISLGPDCLNTWNLRSYFGIERAYPFDWWITPAKSMLMMIEPGFSFHLSRGDLRITSPDVHNTVYNYKLNILQHHDFHRHWEGHPGVIFSITDEEIENLNCKYIRLFKRLGQDIRNASNPVAVLSGSFGGWSSEVKGIPANQGLNGYIPPVELAREVRDRLGKKLKLAFITVGETKFEDYEWGWEIRLPDTGGRENIQGIEWAEPIHVYRKAYRQIGLSSSKNCKLSIIVPVYNGIKYIHSTLASLAEIEKLVSCEIIFQNCLSTDGTTEVLDCFCRQGSNRFLYNEADSGQSDAINRGVERARGKWVTWLCADDMLLPELVNALDESEQAGADLIYGDIIFVENNIFYPAIGTERHVPGALAGRRLIIQQPGTCILRKVWRDAGGLQCHLNWSMDYDLFLRLESEGKKFHRSELFTAVIRVHPDAKTSSGSIKRLFEIWTIIYQSHRRCPKYFRMRPYLIYAIEYIIKFLEAARSPTGKFPGRILSGLLHRVFWAVAAPRESTAIAERYSAVKTGSANRIQQFVAES